MDAKVKAYRSKCKKCKWCKYYRFWDYEDTAYTCQYSECTLKEKVVDSNIRRFCKWYEVDDSEDETVECVEESEDYEV